MEYGVRKKATEERGIRGGGMGGVSEGSTNERGKVMVTETLTPEIMA